MPAVAHLSRLWSAFANSRSIFQGAIAAEHINRGMLLQPGFDGRNLAVGEQINGLTVLQIQDQRAMAESALVCPVVQANDARRGLGGLWKAADQTQDGIATPAETLFLTSVSACLASDSESKPTERLLQPCGALSVRTTELRESFGENLLSTGALFTEKATYMHDQRLCCKNSRRAYGARGSPFLLGLGRHSKEAGDEGHLPGDVAFAPPSDLSLAHHVHDLVSL